MAANNSIAKMIFYVPNLLRLRDELKQNKVRKKMLRAMLRQLIKFEIKWRWIISKI